MKRFLCLLFLAGAFVVIQAGSASATVEAGSCVGVDACPDPVGVTTDVGADSCIGVSACAGAEGTIGANSCIGDFACSGAKGTIGANSCIGDDACSQAEGNIGANSCNGDEACLEDVTDIGDCERNLVPVAACDTEPPTWTVPADITVVATGLGGGEVSYVATVSDNVGVVSESCAPATGTTFPVGMTTVNCTASDAVGNVGTASFNVIVGVDEARSTP